MSATFPGDIEARFRALIRDHIEDTATKEWPTLAHRSASLRFTPPNLAKALQLTLTLGPEAEGLFTLFAILFAFIGVQILALGIIGEYVGRVYNEVRKRPRFVIRQVYTPAGRPPLVRASV